MTLKNQGRDTRISSLIFLPPKQLKHVDSNLITIIYLGGECQDSAFLLEGHFTMKNPFSCDDSRAEQWWIVISRGHSLYPLCSVLHLQGTLGLTVIYLKRFLTCFMEPRSQRASVSSPLAIIHTEHVGKSLGWSNGLLHHSKPWHHPGSALRPLLLTHPLACSLLNICLNLASMALAGGNSWVTAPRLILRGLEGRKFVQSAFPT